METMDLVAPSGLFVGSVVASDGIVYPVTAGATAVCTVPVGVALTLIGAGYLPLDVNT